MSLDTIGEYRREITRVAVSEHPADHYQLELDRDQRTLELRDCNGAPILKVELTPVGAVLEISHVNIVRNYSDAPVIEL